MYFKFVFRALRRQVKQRLMIAVTIALGAALTTSMLAVMLDVGDKVNAELGSYGANIEVLPQGAAAVAEIYEVDDSVSHGALRGADLPNLKTIFWALNIVDFSPFLSVQVTAAQDAEPLTLVGTWWAKELALPTGQEVSTGIRGLREWWSVEGGWPADDAPDQVMVGARLANRMGWNQGDEITLTSPTGSATFQIVGIFTSGSAEDDQIYATLAAAQELAERSGEIDKVEVRAITTPENELAQRAARDPRSLSIAEWEVWYCTAYVSSIAYQIEEVMEGAVAKPVRQIADTEGVILEQTQLIMVMVAVLATVASSLGIANLVTASVMERAREIGLLKAIGARNISVVMLILTETLLVGLLGGAIGFGGGIALAQVVGHLVFGSSIALRTMVLPLMAMIVLATILAGCLPSIHSLLKLKPAQVLHGR